MIRDNNFIVTFQFYRFKAISAEQQFRIFFIDNGDKIQRMFIWEIYSLICQNNKGEYYVLVIDHNNDVIEFSDKQIPSNWKVNLSDVSIVDRVMREAKFVFYKLQ